MSKIREALRKSQNERREAPGGNTQQNQKSPYPDVLPSEVRRLADSLGATSSVGYTKQNWTLEGLFTRGPGENCLVADEELKKLSASLLRRKQTSPESIFLVTSALPEEGKTFVTVNLARILAQGKNQTVLLIDGDLRHPTAHQMLGAPPTPGLAEYLKGEAKVSEILQRGPLPNLFFLPAGDCRGNSMELLSGASLKKLFGGFSTLFDWILVDSPPALLVADVQLLVPLVHGVLLVVGAGISSRETVTKARDMVADRGILGVVLNYAELGDSYTSHYYDKGYLQKHSRK